MMIWRVFGLLACLGGVISAVAACGDATGPVPAEALIELRLEGLRSLDPDREGTYEVWVVGEDGRILSAGGFTAPASGPITAESPLGKPEHVMITVEPPGDSAPDRPSTQTLLGGEFDGSTARLGVNRYITAGIPLEEEPGTHVLFTPSNNMELNYPSREDAGIWLFNIGGDTLDGSFYLKFTPLTRGWTYEGWMVRDYGTPSAVWLSYGKFEVNRYREADTRDDTGLGPFSGQLHYERAMPDEVVTPGDDWVANPHGYPVPGGLELPLDLNGVPEQGIESRWTHVITIEPISDEDENPWLARPFPLLQPYQNPVGEGSADEPRTIRFYPERLPSGTATLEPIASSPGVF